MSSLPFALLNSIIHWSRWSVVWKWIIEQRCYTHLILRSSCLYILGELNCQGSEKRLLKDESNSVTSHPSLLDFPLQILAYKLKSGVVSVEQHPAWISYISTRAHCLQHFWQANTIGFTFSYKSLNFIIWYSGNLSKVWCIKHSSACRITKTTRSSKDECSTRLKQSSLVYRSF